MLAKESTTETTASAITNHSNLVRTRHSKGRPAAPSAAAPPSAPPGYQASTEQDDEADLDEADLDEPDASEGYFDGATLTAAASVAHQRPGAGRDAGL